MNRWAYISFVFLFFSCQGEEQVEKEDVNWDKYDSSYLGKEIAIQEEIDIKLFLEQHKDWKMVKTGSGLQYYIYEEGAQDTSVYANEGDVAEIEFSVKLLDGTLCYETEEDMYEEIVVDNSEIETGIQEGIKKLSVGDKAKLIIPSHLGHGLIGDMDKIPPLNTLIIDVHLLGIQKR